MIRSCGRLCYLIWLRVCFCIEEKLRVNRELLTFMAADANMMLRKSVDRNTSNKVEDMHDPPTWREFLGNIIKDPQERQRIANELNVSMITLTRWVNNESKPRPHNLGLLIKALPDYRTQLVEMIAEEFDEFADATSSTSTDNKPEEIPANFYVRVFHANSELPPSLHSWSISDLVLRQALEQLDPDHKGMALIAAKCMPPSSERAIRSLREIIGRGTPPWKRELEQNAILLGAESMAGYVVTTGRSITSQNLKEDKGMFPAHKAEWEVSATVHPIMRGGRIAGCLVASSTQLDYFPASRTILVQNYADLLVLAFEPHDFYDLERMKFGVLPRYDVQQSHLANFQERVAKLMIDSLSRRQPISSTEAELFIWQQVEKELLHLSTGAEV